MIFVGIDDTDVIDARGTNQLAKAMVRELADAWTCKQIVRHQLFFDDRIPYTSQNGSASLWMEPLGMETAEDLTGRLEELMRADFIPGSDPGLCVAEQVSERLVEFGLRCKSELMTQSAAFELARSEKVLLKALGGTGDGVIGALAAVGLATTQNDGRIVQMGSWPDDLQGWQTVQVLQSRGVRCVDRSERHVSDCKSIDVGKHLRPNLRNSEIVLFVEPDSEASNPGTYRALKVK